MFTPINPATTVYRVNFTDRHGLHVGAPRFFLRAKAERWRRLLLRDPAVKEAHVSPVVLRPLQLHQPGEEDSTMPRKTCDPKRLALMDKADKARADFERWYGKAKRAFTGMEKARQRLIRLQRQIQQLDATQQ